jgi:tryptophanyl-tRNA synthetase
LLLSMVTPLGWLERVPTYKEALENVKDKDLHTYGFLGYPTLQTADIVMYSEEGMPLVVPVGEDQVSHVELSREIVRRFNTYYGLHIGSEIFVEANRRSLRSLWSDTLRLQELPFKMDPGGDIATEWAQLYERTIRERIYEVGFVNILGKLPPGSEDWIWWNDILSEPDSMLTKTPRIPGLDGRKMSKSYGNAITLSESDADIRTKTKVMVTDPARKRRTDPGNPDVCPVYDWHKLFSTPETLQWAAEGCRTAGIGCIECKDAMATNLIRWIAPVRERRMKWENDSKGVLEIINAGSQQAREVAKKTMERVRDAVFHWKDKRKELGGSAAG